MNNFWNYLMPTFKRNQTPYGHFIVALDKSKIKEIVIAPPHFPQKTLTISGFLYVSLFSLSLYCFFPPCTLFLFLMFKITPQLSERINHFARFPQTGVSLRQMVMMGNHFLEIIYFTFYANCIFILGPRPSPLTFFKASQFLHGSDNMLYTYKLL